MKTIAKVMCIFMFIGFVAKGHAQTKKETVTHYYYTLVYLEGKNVGITPVLSGTVENTPIYRPVCAVWRKNISTYSRE